VTETFVEKLHKIYISVQCCKYSLTLSMFVCLVRFFDVSNECADFTARRVRPCVADLTMSAVNVGPRVSTLTQKQLFQWPNCSMSDALKTWQSATSCKYGKARIPRHRHRQRHRLARRTYILTSDTRDFLARVLARMSASEVSVS